MTQAAAPSQAFSISTPDVNIALPLGRTVSVPFTVTNLAGHDLHAKCIPTALGEGSQGWYSVEGEAERPFADGSVQQVIVDVVPPLGVAAGVYAFRLDMRGIEQPGVDYTEGPACAVEVPASTAGVTTPRGYVATLVGAAAGGILWLIMVLAIVIIAKTHTSHCSGFGDCFGDALGLALFLVFLLFVGYVLMVIFSGIGIWFALKRKHYQGAVLTGGFHMVFMIPWSILVGVVLNAIGLGGTAVVILAPLLLLIVPAVLARGLVLLIKTHHI
jgi:hypothetical protein